MKEIFYCVKPSSRPCHVQCEDCRRFSPPSPSGADQVGEISQEEAIKELTAIMREADDAFETLGGSTRHYVAGLLIPMMEKKGLFIIRKPYPIPSK